MLRKSVVHFDEKHVLQSSPRVDSPPDILFVGGPAKTLRDLFSFPMKDF